MSLDNFFHINMPYGIQRKRGTNKWAPFNREYKNLSNTKDSFDGTKCVEYEGLTDDLLKTLAERDEDSIRRDPTDNKIDYIFFYHDATDPSIHKRYPEAYHLWEAYLRRIKILSELKSI